MPRTKPALDPPVARIPDSYKSDAGKATDYAILAELVEQTTLRPMPSDVLVVLQHQTEAEKIWSLQLVPLSSDVETSAVAGSMTASNPQTTD